MFGFDPLDGAEPADPSHRPVTDDVLEDAVGRMPDRLGFRQFDEHIVSRREHLVTFECRRRIRHLGIGTPAREQVETPSVPRADDLPPCEATRTQQSPLVRTPVFHRDKPALVPEKRNPPTRNLADGDLGQFFQRSDAYTLRHGESSRFRTNSF